MNNFLASTGALLRDFYKEITFQGSPDELIEVANFLLKYAEVMKVNNNAFEHAHLKDEHPKWKKAQPDIVIHK